MTSTRPPAFAGTFYPDDPNALSATLRALLGDVTHSARPAPKAIIAPHAGYVYSGPIAAQAYAALAPAGAVGRVVLIGPSHHVAVDGAALPAADAFETPLGRIPVDRATCTALARAPGVTVSDRAHADEHSLEVHLPFLQTVLGDFALVPLVVGDGAPQEIASLLSMVWDGPTTRIVVSSDLSHFQP